MINKKILGILRNELDLFFTLPLSLPFLILIIIIYPFVKIKVGFLRSDRIGHFTLDTELYLLEKKNKKIKSIDLFYLGRKIVCNKTLLRLWKKQLIVLPRIILRPLCLQIRYFNFLNFLRCGQTLCNQRDILNLLDQYPSTIKLNYDDLANGENERLKIKLPKKAKFVCLIVRDSSYLEKLYGQKMSIHDYRNADIDDFVKACDALTELGYYVIRMGAVVNKPINTKNKMIIDYAFNNLRTDFMDIYLASQCEFCLTTGTGFDGTTLMFRKPNIYVNIAPFFDIRMECSALLTIPCHYYSKKLSRKLTITEITNSKSAVYLDSKHFQDDGIELIKNTPEEIKEIAIEAAKRNRKEWVDTDGDILNKKFVKVFPSKKTFNKIIRHGKIKGKIGSDFLKKNQWWLN
jgi:putative glycosyltransferase (TIGR04372 family)